MYEDPPISVYLLMLTSMLSILLSDKLLPFNKISSSSCRTLEKSLFRILLISFSKRNGLDIVLKALFAVILVFGIIYVASIFK